VGHDLLPYRQHVVTMPPVQSPAELFAANMKRFREIRGESQESFALSAGIHRTEVTKLESGRRDPKLTTVVKVAEALGVTVAELLDGVHELPEATGP
jgi:transcriptional regulator with XRE-family HTH domain